MKKQVLFTFYFLLFTFYSNAQLLYLQENYKGGVSVDGKEYYGGDNLNVDTITFVNTVPAGSTIKKALLLSLRFVALVGSVPEHDNPLQLLFNNNAITIDSTDIATPAFYGYGLTANEPNWITVKDVTPYTQNNNNQLITPCQSCSLYNNIPNWDYEYSSFLLVILYENNTMPATNVALFLNSQHLGQNMTFNLSGLNSIDNTKDAGLSIWTDNLNFEYPINFILNSTTGNFNLGNLWFNEAYATIPKSELLAPGSFYYQNNTLFGLQDDSPNPFIDSTDALANIKTYIGNGTTSFSLSATLNPQGYDYLNGFVLAYSSPCPARGITPAQNYSLCLGNSQQLTINSSTVNTSYNWYATNSSLSSYTVANPIASPTVSTNYTAYVDSAGCKHTEHFSIAVYANPKFDSLIIGNVICGNAANTGGLNFVGTKGGVAPYTYNIGGAAQTSNYFYNLVVGNYTATVTDNNGCTEQQAFTIKQVITTQVNFTYAPTVICVNEPVAFTNTTTNANLQTWSFDLQDSTPQSPVHVFTDTGTYQITLIAWRNQRQCSDTLTKTLVVKDCPPDSIKIIVPNVFSPNADGINDVWQVLVYNFNYTVNNYECLIYDRWGIKIFETNNINTAWDGKTTSGLPSSAGTYYYIIKLTATNSKGVSEQKDYKGYLELVR